MPENYRDKNFLIVIPAFDIGGAERQATYLATYLKQKGTRVSVLSIDGKREGPLLDYFTSMNIPCTATLVNKYFLSQKLRFVPSPSNYRFLKKVWHEIRNFKAVLRNLKPDVIIPFCYEPNLFCNNFYDSRKFSCWNQRDLGYPAFTGSYFEKRAFKRTKKVISNSKSGAEYVSRNTTIPLEEIKVVYNVVNLPAPLIKREAMRQDLAVLQNEILITMVSNFAPVKNHEIIIEALADIIQSNTRVKVLLAGRFDGNEKNLEQLIAQKTLEKYVIIKPFQLDVSSLYAASDIAVHSSFSEGLPNGLIEPMFFGLPVVASEIESHTEVLGKDYAFLFNPKDKKQLGNCLLQLIEDESLRQQNGQKAKAIIAERYSLEKVMTNYLDLLN